MEERVHSLVVKFWSPKPKSSVRVGVDPQKTFSLDTRIRSIKSTVTYVGVSAVSWYILCMVTKEDVQKLADLAHITVAQDELEKVASEMDATLAYVSQVTTLTGVVPQEHTKMQLRNVMRDDVVVTEKGAYTKDIVAQFPDKDGNALRVKKIL